MMKINYLCVLFVLLCNFSFAQYISVDTLKKFTYSDLGEKFYNYYNQDQINKAKLISKYFLKKSKFEKEKDQIVEGYVMMHFNETLPNALKYIDSVQTITHNSNKNVYPARIYLLKANLYFKFDNQVKALENYILGLKYAQENNNKRQIAYAEINIAYLHNYVGKHKEAAKTLRHYLYNADYLDKAQLDDIHLNLASTYLDINTMDSAKILIEEGLKSSKLDEPYRYNKYLSLFGLYSLKRKNYQTAIDNLNKSKNFFLTKTNDLNQNYALMYLGQAYAGLQQKENAIKNFVKIDSIVQKTNNTFPELRDVYTYLINYYKEKKDKEQQLFYIERFLKIDKILDSQRNILSKELPQKYDTPKLLKEKETIINDLKNRKITLYTSIGLLLVVLLLVIYLYYLSKQRENKYRKIAQELINAVENKNSESVDIKPDIIQVSTPIEAEDKANKTIPEDVIQFVLNGLYNFEAQELFLRKGITLASLAKKIKTNTAYLSEIINTNKGKNFATYLNDLRIDYAIKRLAKDKKFRSYKIPFIAEELGYNNEQAFTVAFKKRAGTPLSVYLKEIEKKEN